MTKSNAVRAVLRRYEPIFTSDVAIEAGCTQPLVFQVIRSMKWDGEIFDDRQIGRRVSYRLLPPDEAKERRAARATLEAEAFRAREIAGLREEVASARAMLDNALQRLEVLAS
jgi:hypothetical protein